MKRGVFFIKALRKSKKQLKSLQAVPTALKERHEILIDSNQLITFEAWTSCTTRNLYWSNGVLVVFEEYSNYNFKAVDDSFECDQFWQYFLVLYKKTLPDKSLKALLMNDWLTLDSYGLVAYVENFHNDYLKVCLSYKGKRLKSEQKDDLLDKFFQAVNKIVQENN